ncbi:MAG TPA: hypothetical protein VEJ88_06885, partial [Dissulfurispiraceae bacterium]|nr:hypothetical protein [Dissulfurispiraceae bacterium]
GLVLHFPLLPTPPHGDAVTFSYRPESVCLKGDFHPSDHAHSQAHSFRRKPASSDPIERSEVAGCRIESGMTAKYVKKRWTHYTIASFTHLMT